MTLPRWTCPTRLCGRVEIGRWHDVGRGTDDTGSAPGPPERQNVFFRCCAGVGRYGTSAVVPRHRGVEALGGCPRATGVEAVRAAQNEVALLGMAVVVGDGWEP